MTCDQDEDQDQLRSQIEEMADCGKSAGVVELSDGRFVSWESSFEPSGSGFYCDFVGGGADVFVARTEAAALSMISEQAREMFGGARS